jgi:hypothetical protein
MSFLPTIVKYWKHKECFENSKSSDFNSTVKFAGILGRAAKFLAVHMILFPIFIRDKNICTRISLLRDQIPQRLHN